MGKRKDGDGILLESGTSEIEVTKLSVLGGSYGINVVKIQEITMSDKVESMSHIHPAMEDIFKPRDTLITVINLVFCLSGVRPENDTRDLLIITNFNKIMVALHVRNVGGISRISWGNIQKPDKTIPNGDEGMATGIAQYDSQLVAILDFEKVAAEIAPETTVQISEIEKLGDKSICNYPIVAVEDFTLLRKMIDDALERTGFMYITSFNNRQRAWDYLQTVKSDSGLHERVSLVITGIEILKMDGHRLTKLIKEDSRLRRIPVVVFSSPVDEQMRKKGKELGADEQLAEPEMGHLVSVLDEPLGKSNPSRAHA